MPDTQNTRDLGSLLGSNKASPTNALAQIDYAVDLDNRIIYLEDEIDIYTAGFIKSRINVIRTLDPKREDDPITLEVTSYGGDVYGMFAAIDVLQAAPVKINTLGRGPIMSAAAFILAAGTGTRAITRNSIIMVHELSTLLSGTSRDIVTEAAHIKKLQIKMYDLLEKCCTKTAEYWESNARVNLYLEAEQAVEHGIVDSILE